MYCKGKKHVPDVSGFEVLTIYPTPMAISITFFKFVASNGMVSLAILEGGHLFKIAMRSLQDSNLRGQSPTDF